MQRALHAAQVTRPVNCMQDPSSIPISGSQHVSGIDDGLGSIGIRISICSLMGDSFSATIGLPALLGCSVTMLGDLRGLSAAGCGQELEMVGYVPMYLVASPWKLAEAGLDVLLNHGLQLRPSATLSGGSNAGCGFVVSDKPLTIKTAALILVMMLSTDRDLGECRC